MNKNNSFDKVFVIDPGMASYVGHHHNWNMVLQKGFSKRKIDTCFLVSKKMPEHKNSLYSNISSFFSFEPRREGGYAYDGSTANLISKQATLFQSELANGLEGEISETTLILMHSVTSAGTMLGLAQWYANLPQNNRPYLYVIIHFFFSPPDRNAEKAFSNAGQLLKGEQKVRVATFVDSIARLLRKSGLEPLLQPLPLEYIGNSAPPVADRLVFGFAGTGVLQKQISILPESIELYLAKGGVGCFQIQMNPVKPAEHIINALTNLEIRYPDRLSFIPEAIFPNSAFYEYISGFSACILPYSPAVFHQYRPSQVFLESACLGKPAIVCQNSWLAQEALKLDNGSMILANASPATLADAMLAFEETAIERLAQAQRVGQRLRLLNNSEAFFEIIFGTFAHSLKDSAMYTCDDSFLLNMAGLGNNAISTVDIKNRRFLFCDPRLNYQLFSLRHPEYAYLRGDISTFLQQINCYFDKKAYEFKINDKFIQYQTVDFRHLPTLDLEYKARKNGVLIGTSIAPKRIDTQKEAINTWVVQGFDVVSVNYEDEIAILREHFPEVRFVKNKRDSLEILGKKRIFLNDIFDELLLHEHEYEIYGLVNSDISLHPLDIVKLKNTAANNVVYSQRLEVPGYYAYVPGVDIFFFNKKALLSCSKNISIFLLGETYWDYFIPLMLLIEGHILCKASPPMGSHQSHKLGWTWKDWRNMLEVLAEYFKHNYSRLPFADRKKLDGLLVDNTDPLIIGDLVLYIISCPLRTCNCIAQTATAQKNNEAISFTLLDSNQCLRDYLLHIRTKTAVILGKVIVRLFKTVMNPFIILFSRIRDWGAKH